jgi:hypothetical protein
MSEMRDRVTAAIISSIIDAGGVIDYRVQDVARVAISAMREPTPEMLDAGLMVWRQCHHIEGVWRAMIDRALAEKESGK